ncbi:MAG: phenylacetate--CoA ligase family protein [Desulfobacterium sp.]|nr:phenylacetate--CoA ligase family protein [Desulfobacterium sp.]MBU3947708.1 AMP-binding protein [Pseudomonadota bacterium]MBU4009332.1 AMP-binding protein [Pseudomonadota bacterium]MBU4035049.1 AMP-binding protein [Pseudomonadota bacterium]
MISKTPLEDWILKKISPKKDSSNLSRATIENFQLEKIKETIAYARLKSPFYKKLLAGFGSNPVRSFQDLSILPFTTSDDLKDQPMQFLCVSQSTIERCVTLQSSATTGSAKRIFFTKEDLEHTLDFFHHGMSTLVKAGDRVMILLPGDRPDSVGDLLSRALLRINVNSIKHGFVTNPEKTLNDVLKDDITCLVGTPVQILALFRCNKGKENLKDRSMKVLLTTDYVPSIISTVLENIYNCEVYSHYGMTEMGYGGGVECSARCGHHMREADLFIEIIDPKTGKILPDGEMGEIVLTTLNRIGMPLIRYRTGDMSRFLTNPCPCGTVLKRLDKIACRINSVVYLASGEPLFMPLLDEALFELPDVMDFTAELENKGDKDCLKIKLVLAAQANDDEVCAAAMKKIKLIPQIEASKKQLFIEPVKYISDLIISSGTQKRTLSDNRKEQSYTSGEFEGI